MPEQPLRTVGADAHPDEERIDSHIRPQRLADYLGQVSVREKLDLVDEIWKSVHSEADSLEVPVEEKTLPDHRWAEFLA